jgi:SAM-dependent methyltransferase
MSVEAILKGYADAAEDQIARMEVIDAARLLAPVAACLGRPERMLDVGAGTGRNAAWFAGRGSQATAVEPVAELREAGRALHGAAVRWIDDRLPALETVRAGGDRFDLILLSAVWQHLDAPDRAEAMPVLAGLLAPDGVLILSLRHGPGAPTRPVFPCTPEAAIDLARDAGLSLRHREAAASVQAGNIANGVHWTWLALDR